MDSILNQRNRYRVVWNRSTWRVVIWWRDGSAGDRVRVVLHGGGQE